MPLIKALLNFHALLVLCPVGSFLPGVAVQPLATLVRSFGGPPFHDSRQHESSPWTCPRRRMAPAPLGWPCDHAGRGGHDARRTTGRRGGAGSRARGPGTIARAQAD